MRKIDVHAIIDNARFKPFHWMVMCWCALLLIFDGYDLFIYGVVLPVLMKEWGLTPLEAMASKTAVVALRLPTATDRPSGLNVGVRPPAVGPTPSVRTSRPSRVSQSRAAVP